MKVQTTVVGNGVELRHFPQTVLEDVFKQTSIPNPLYESIERYSPWGAPKNVSATIDFAEFTDTGLRLPRGAYTFLSKDIRLRIIRAKSTDQRVYRPVAFPKLRLKLNAEQVQCVTSFLAAVKAQSRPFGNFLFLASTSVGKTILQATIAAKLGQRALVICPTDQIMRAWYADLLKAFGLKKNQIGLVRGKSFKVVGPFTLATPQTLGRREKRWSELNEQFGTVVVDETHIVSAPQLFAFLKQSPAAYMVGATATAGARVGINYHLKALMGDPIVNLNTYGHDTESSMRVSGVNLVTTNFEFEHQTDNIDWFQLGLALTSDEARNALIVSNVYKEWLDQRVILVVTKLREHVEVLYQMLLEAGVTNINRITGSTNAQKFYTERLMRAIQDRKVTCIIATQQAITIGANIPMLDSLHIAIPPANKRDLSQLIGRIRRKAAGKTAATLTYYMDTKMGYLMHLYRRVVVPTFQDLKLPGFNVYQ